MPQVWVVGVRGKERAGVRYNQQKVIKQPKSESIGSEPINNQTQQKGRILQSVYDIV